MSDSQSSDNSLLEVILSWKDQCFFIYDVSDFTLLMKLDCWGASKTVSAKRTMVQKDIRYFPVLRLVLAMGQGNPPSVRVWTAKPGLFSSRPNQNPTHWLLGGQTRTSIGEPRCFPGFGWMGRFQSPVLHFGFHIYGRLQICYCESQNIDIGTANFIVGVLAVLMCKTSILMCLTTSWNWPSTERQRYLDLHLR